jgi:hypothetical protein
MDPSPAKEHHSGTIFYGTVAEVAVKTTNRDMGSNSHT